jgi:hypothetical protein
MTARSHSRPAGAAVWACAAAGLLAAGFGLWLRSASALEAWLLAFVILSGLAAGSLGLLMIGHLMSEEWLTPVRDETEAAALTAPLLLPLAVPLAGGLASLYPWAAPGAALDLPPARAAYLDPAFFLARGGVYLIVWCALALWIARTRHVRRASAVGLALLAPTMTFAGNDWVLSREPSWWSSLFGFALAASHLLAALAGAILLSLSEPEHPTAIRMKSLERALLTLALLALWMWFVHYLIVWLADVPDEVAWYLARSGSWLGMLGLAVASLVAAILILAPPGFTRRTMMVGSALLLVQHAAFMIWIVRPAAREPALSWVDAVVAGGLAAVWGAAFAVALKHRRAAAPRFATPSP